MLLVLLMACTCLVASLLREHRRQCSSATHLMLQLRHNLTSDGPLAALVVPDLSGRKESILLDVAKQVLAHERTGRGRKVIAMSLYGNNTRYTQGAILNAVLARRDWPDWTLRFYYGDGVPEHDLRILKTLGSELVKIDLVQNSRVSMYWRFFALEDRTATRIISRDADAQLSLRDRAAVREWIASGHLFHTLHDHYGHGTPILGGMWGAVNGFLNPQLMQDWRQSKDQSSGVWGNDQDWLAKVVWPLVKNNTLDHASFFCKKYGASEWRGFPSQRLHGYDFVGNAYTPQDNFLGICLRATCPAECRRQPEWKSC